MSEIGGYFELEINKGQYSFHDTPYALKSGRASLHCILALVKPTLVYLPFYTCDALLEPFEAGNIPYQFYTVNSTLEPEHLPTLSEGEYFLCVNYLGLQGQMVNLLSELYKNKLIVDCTQAFFMKGNGVSWYFNSCRKFFGVPDGSYLYAPSGVELQMPSERNEDYTTTHLLLRYNGHTTEGYEYFVQNEALAGKGVLHISRLSETLLATIDYEWVKAKRRENYSYLHNKLRHLNMFDASLSDSDVPMSYPFLTDRNIDKAIAASSGIFIPSFWRDTGNRGIAGFEFEKSLADKLLPLPIDHRYSFAHMHRLCGFIIDQMK